MHNILSLIDGKVTVIIHANKTITPIDVIKAIVDRHSLFF